MTILRVKLDENLGTSHLEYLREAGYDAEGVYDEGLSGASDDEVLARASAEKRMLITLDLDFADVRRYPPGTHAGVLVLRPRARGARAVLGLLTRVLIRHSLEEFRECLAVADETVTRLRRPPCLPGG